MSTDQPIHWQLQWQHVAPMMEDLYAQNNGAGLLPWAKQNWHVLAHAGFTCAASESSRMDSVIRAISLGHMHFLFNHLCWQETFETNYAQPLHPHIDPAKVFELATERYVEESSIPDHVSGCIDCALRCVVPMQSTQILALLKEYYGSVDGVCESMLDHLAFGSSGPYVSDVAGVDSAFDFFRSINCDGELEHSHAPG